MTVTSADIAQRAGVSRATVSYVLNAAPNQTISEATREAVLRAARDLGYRPNAAARSLRSGRGSAVLFPLPGLSHTYVVDRLVQACQRALEREGLSLVTDHTVYGSLDAQLDAWLRHAPAGVLDLVIPHDDPVLAALRERGVRVLSSALGSDSAWESTSDALALLCRATQVEHLLDRGARRITMVLPPRPPTDARLVRKGISEMRGTVRRHGGTLSVARARLAGDAMTRLVRAWSDGRLPDAVAAYNDDYAIALLTALVAQGYRVPDDVKLIGVDDVPLSSVVTPSLSTITADFDDYAAALTASVLGSLDGRSRTSELPVPAHQLVVRASTS